MCYGYCIAVVHKNDYPDETVGEVRNYAESNWYVQTFQKDYVSFVEIYVKTNRPGNTYVVTKYSRKKEIGLFLERKLSMCNKYAIVKVSDNEIVTHTKHNLFVSLKEAESTASELAKESPGDEYVVVQLKKGFKCNTLEVKEY